METETALAPRARALWEDYVANEIGAGHPAPRLYDTMMIGGDAASADVGARLILPGRNTTTSALPSDFEGPGQRPPRPGDLSLVLDGRGDPVCIVRTVSVQTQPFRDMDEAFAWDYGEWDGTLATWRDRMLAYYADRLMEDPLDAPLVCERSTRIWPLPA